MTTGPSTLLALARARAFQVVARARTARVEVHLARRASDRLVPRRRLDLGRGHVTVRSRGQSELRRRSRS
eukprot:2111855-Rhodomonas_salina.1